jgi:hypothetical protein
MRHFIPLALFSHLFVGCVIYDETLITDTAEDTDGRDASGERPDGATEEQVLNLRLDPAGGLPGDTSILSLTGDGAADLGTVASVRFYGEANIEVLATDTRGSNEFLLTIDIPEDAALGDNDLLVEFANGAAVMVDAAFQVVSDPAQIPASPDTGTGDGASGGSSGDSGGSSGSTEEPCGS